MTVVGVEPLEGLARTARQELSHRFDVGPLLSSRGPFALCQAHERGRTRRVVVRVLPRRPLEAARRESAALRIIATAAMEHPHLVPLYEWGLTDHLLWYAMPHVDGRSLADVVREHGPLERACLYRVLRQIGGALQYAHHAGVVHGDVRPETVLLHGDRAWLTDPAVGRLRALRRGAAAPDPALDQDALMAVARAAGLESPVDSSGAARFPTILNLVAALTGSALGAGAGGRRSPAPVESTVKPPVLLVRGGGPPMRWPQVAAATLVLLVTGFVWERVTDPPVSLPATPERSTAAPPLQAAPLYAGPPPPRPSVKDSIRIAGAPLRPAPSRVRTQRPRAPAARPSPPPADGSLDVGTVPWGRLYVDGVLVGNTPVAGLALPPGSHLVRIVRDGYQPFERVIAIQPGQRSRLVGIELQSQVP